VLLTFMETVKAFKSQQMLETWHFRTEVTPGKRLYIQLRLKPIPEHFEFIQQQTTKVAAKMVKEQLIQGQSMDFRHTGFDFSEGAMKMSLDKQGYSDEVQEACWDLWDAKVTWLQYLSESVVQLLRIEWPKLRKEYFHEFLLQNLFNMIGAQHLHLEYPLRSGSEEKLLKLVDPVEREQFRLKENYYGKCVGWRDNSRLKVAAFFGDVP
jgi:hypothetical protein